MVRRGSHVPIESGERDGVPDERNSSSMNLYRNFGNLLESWVTEGSQDLYLQTGSGLDRLDSVSRDSVPLSNVKSESEDSGFETVSTTSPCHSHQCSVLTSEESQPAFGSTEDEAQPSSPSPSVCSSSSSSVTLSSVAPITTCLEVEQVLRRTDSPSWRGPLQQIERGTAGPRYRSNTTSCTASFHSNSSRSHHRYARPRRTHSQPPDPKKAALYRKHLKSHQHGQSVHSQLEVSSQHLLLLKMFVLNNLHRNIFKSRYKTHFFFILWCCLRCTFICLITFFVFQFVLQFFFELVQHLFLNRL